MSVNFKSLRFAVLLMFTLIVGTLQAQTVTGTVKDSFGDPVIGATVLEKGTKNGVATDLDGNFTLKTNSGKALVVSYIGMKTQEVSIAGKSNVAVVLEDESTTLGDVVVVGYGTVKKNDLTGSVSSVSTEDLNKKGAPSVMENLQGANPGVNITMSGRVGASPEIEIRGKSSINSATKPLYVVDGVMCDDIDWLNPQDIERIDVLKDASSTAIYGSRATAGVVMVTTRGGLNIKKAEKATISYDGYYGWTTTARMPEFMNGEQFYNYRFLKFLTPIPSNPAAQANPASPVYSMDNKDTIGQCLLAYNSGEASEGFPHGFALKSMLANGNTVDWPGEVTQTGHQQNHYIAVSGSSEKVNYHVGLGYNGMEGVYKNDSQDRINFKGSVDAKINNVVSAGFNFNLARIQNKYANDDAVQYAYRMNPYMQAYDADGNIILKSGNFEALGTDQYQFSDQISPLKLLQNQKKERETWRALGNIYVQLNLMKGLTFKTTFSPSFTYYRQGTVAGIKDPSNPHHTYDNTEWEQLNKETGLYEVIPAEGDGAATWNTITRQTSRSFTYTWDNIINWNKTFAEKHDVALMGLYSMQAGNSEGSTWVANNLAVDGAEWWSMGDGTFDKAKSKTTYGENSMISYALRANYSFMSKYLLTATVRWDGSSRFAKDYRWGSFPSFAAAWRITEENFMKNVDWVSNLKLRVSYGVTGNNTGIGNYDTQAVAIKGMYYPLGGIYGSGYAASVIDKALQWEKSHEWNLGLDFGFLRNRISGSIDWYSKTSNDLLYDVRLPLEAGVDSDGKPIKLTTNVGSVRNTGVEVALTGVIVDNKDWNVTLSGNFSCNKNKIRQIDGAAESLKDGVSNSLFVGYSTNTIWGYESAGIVNDRMMTVPDHTIAVKKGFTPGEQVKSSEYYYQCYGLLEGQPIIKDVNGDGSIDTQNDRVIKNRDPKWIGNLNLNVSYKGWDLSASLYARVGQYSFSNFLGEYLNYADRGRQKINVDYYIPAGTLVNCDGMNADGTLINPVYQETTHYGDYPFPNNGDSNGVGKLKAEWDEAKCIVKTSFAKIKNITLGYTFPKTMLKPWGCQSLRLYFTVTNPFVFTSYKGFDPEWADATLKQDNPSTITYQIGASIKF